MTLSREQLGVDAGAIVLDVGCAGGAGTALLEQSGCRAVGVELEAHLLEELRSIESTKALSALRGDATRLPIADASVDGVCAVEVLEHIPGTESVIRELRRVLRVGGSLCIAVPTAYTERVYRKLHPRYLTNAEHVHVFDRARMTELLRSSGFTIIRVETRNLAPAIAWFLHALLRTEADPTGRPLEHRCVDAIATAPIWVARRVPGLRRVVAKIEAHFGKSWYFFCVAT